ncbi:MAG TPA: DUF1015 family protein, partial [Anaerolineae bacterium]|nr:DUF1015 family protein [Anaerolineae bacterium]
MANIKAFRGIRYNPDRFCDLSEVITQPYDRIHEAEQAAYYALNPYNFCRIDMGLREPDVYGDTTYADLQALIEAEAAALGVDVVVRQSDSEAQLLEWIHSAADAAEPVILNAGGLTHTSVALRDACAELSAPLRAALRASPSTARPHCRASSINVCRLTPHR